jgi:hypothetical protein
MSANLAESSSTYFAAMADAVRIGPTVAQGAVGRHGSLAWRGTRRTAGPGFHHVLAAATAHGHAQTSRTAVAAAGGVQTAALQGPVAVPRASPTYQSVAAIPAPSNAALQQAMDIEGVPQSWRSGLQFIMAQESTGKVGATNPIHSARGLFQLTRANYHLNPHGERSFGNAVEEAQGGIRYIQQRYGTADNAVAFWQQHRWY